jgi:hypothetical protein
MYNTVNSRLQLLFRRCFGKVCFVKGAIMYSGSFHWAAVNILVQAHYFSRRHGAD